MPNQKFDWGETWCIVTVFAILIIYYKYKFIAKWETKLSIRLTKPKWMVLCNIPFCATNDTRLQWFQYRLVHRTLGVNSFLAKSGKRDNGLCTFCQLESEMLVHLFCRCKFSTMFWTQFWDWIGSTLNINIRLDNEAILFGITKKILGVLLIWSFFFVVSISIKWKWVRIDPPLHYKNRI